MIASVADTGSGILFLFAMLLLAIVVLVWIVAWLPRGFRLRPSGNSDRLRIVARGILIIAIVAMLCFPPLRRTGIWLQPETKNPIPKRLTTSYDRASFGYIPTYAWFGRCFATEARESTFTLSLAPYETYSLDAMNWKVEWLYLIAQITIALLIALPFLFARRQQ